MGAYLNKKRRVVVTGIGLVSPLGLGKEANWSALLEGRSAISLISRFDTSRFSTRIAGEIKNFDAQQFIDRKETRKMDLFIQYAIVAAQLAVDDSGISAEQLKGERTGVYIGSGIGGIGSIEETHRILMEKGPERVSPFFIIQTIINEAPAHISIRFGATGPNLSNATACSTGAHAIGEAFRMIQSGIVERMIAGGAEAPITPLSLAGFCNMKALSERNDEPEKASRPFDAKRDGFVMSEGAGIVLLEDLESAVDRGARIYAELVGYGLNGDAYHVTAPSPDGEGAARVMKMALKDAGVPPEEVQYINAHGTSTPYNDKAETVAIKTVFGEHAYKLGVSSTKSMTGHLLGAAGGLETAITALSVYHQLMPPTINYEFPDPDCDLDYVPGKPRPAEIIYALTNSFGFGGTNACLLLKKFEK
ncbi:MAG TPA: beta-ketoacyl-[acyl-carrier-protein] synthase II [Candidatus Aminicenantes bacterium]|nr:MAG: beta-ketoacyl-[acyl-carrier-protein] synthase II [Candidatus Aminicenantes bacterium]HEK85535.1 beta-ketoacyl-[acyl-carrier-protein] synthase II [Candidatus Aminicenantes bacterium]